MRQISLLIVGDNKTTKSKNTERIRIKKPATSDARVESYSLSGSDNVIEVVEFYSGADELVVEFDVERRVSFS